MLVGMEVVQGREKWGKIGKGVGSQGLVLHSFFPFFCLFTQIYMFFLKIVTLPLFYMA
jgi:hypothetical protein